MCSIFLNPPKSISEAFNVSLYSARECTVVRATLLTQTSSSPLSSKMCIDLLANLHIRQVIERQSKETTILRKGSKLYADLLCEAYSRCQELCAAYAKNFYLGSLLLTEERKRAIWALYVWCCRTDELVDGLNAHMTGFNVLERWEDRLEDIFNGCPYDMLDAALVDTIQRFPLDIKRYMIKGMKLDLSKDRYENIEELYEYCYYVAGTVGLMSVPILGISPVSLAFAETIYDFALCLGIGNQLTNILRDVGEDALKGKIYLPQDELREFGLTNEDIFSRKVTQKWREFMKKQIMRARAFFKQAEEGASRLDCASRWPVFSSLILYQRNLGGN